MKRRTTSSCSDEWWAFDLVAMGCLICGGWKGAVVFTMFLIFMLAQDRLG